jgi:hypothetical protein
LNKKTLTRWVMPTNFQEASGPGHSNPDFSIRFRLLGLPFHFCVRAGVRQTKDVLQRSDFLPAILTEVRKAVLEDHDKAKRESDEKRHPK